MGIEIERKFLLSGDQWKEQARGVLYRQGYLVAEKERSVRIRIAGERAFLTVKGASSGAARLEYEYLIPLGEAEDMLDELCRKPIIEKYRYKIDFSGFTWEIDEFFGENIGLVIAEIELTSENQQFEKPDWIGREVTGDPRYYNANLVSTPFSSWPR